MPKRSSKAPKDAEQIAREVLDSILRKADLSVSEKRKNPAAVALGRLGGMKGGRARAKKLTATQRMDIARKAAIARWSKKKKR